MSKMLNLEELNGTYPNLKDQIQTWFLCHDLHRTMERKQRQVDELLQNQKQLKISTKKHLFLFVWQDGHTRFEVLPPGDEDAIPFQEGPPLIAQFCNDGALLAEKQRHFKQHTTATLRLILKEFQQAAPEGELMVARGGKPKLHIQLNEDLLTFKLL